MGATSRWVAFGGRAGCGWIAPFLGLMAISIAASASAATGIDTRYDYVAQFPQGTDPASMEHWREQVLGRVHQQACLRDRPCVARMLRLALPGDAPREVIAFDLMREIAPGERAAILAAASAAIPGTLLHADSRPSDIGSGLTPTSVP